MAHQTRSGVGWACTLRSDVRDEMREIVPKEGLSAVRRIRSVAMMLPFSPGSKGGNASS